MLFADDLVLCDPDREMMEIRLERDGDNGRKRMGRAKTEHLQTTEDTISYPVRRMKIIQEIGLHGDRNGQLANSPVLQI